MTDLPPDEDVEAPAEDGQASHPGIGMDIEQWIERLRRSDRSLYNLMALEVWAIARTMDNLIPGFWNRFMENRRLALKQYVQHQKTQLKGPEDPSQGKSPTTAEAEGDAGTNAAE